MTAEFEEYTKRTATAVLFVYAAFALLHNLAAKVQSNNILACGYFSVILCAFFACFALSISSFRIHSSLNPQLPQTYLSTGMDEKIVAEQGMLFPVPQAPAYPSITKMSVLPHFGHRC